MISADPSSAKKNSYPIYTQNPDTENTSCNDSKYQDIPLQSSQERQTSQTGMTETNQTQDDYVDNTPVSKVINAKVLKELDSIPERDHKNYETVQQSLSLDDRESL